MRIELKRLWESASSVEKTVFIAGVLFFLLVIT